MSTVDLQSFDQRNSFEMRQILFTPIDKAELDILFADKCKLFFAKSVEEYQQSNPKDGQD